MEKFSPLEFGYERFGRHIAPGVIDGWLKTKGRLLKPSAKSPAGSLCKGMAGTAVYIADSEVRVFGPDYAYAGFPASGDTSEAMPFLWRKLMEVPSEHWMMIVYSNAAVPLGMLHLNCPGDQITAAYVGKSKSLLRVRSSVLAQIAKPFMDAGMTPKAAAEAMHLAREMASGAFDLGNASRAKKYDALIAKFPDLKFRASKLASAGMQASMVSQYIQFAPTHR